MGISNINQVFVDIFNSTNVSLTANQEFLGTVQDVSQYVQISINYNTNVSSITNGVIFEFSNDQITWDTGQHFTTIINPLTLHYNGKYVCNIINKFFRLRYTNGAMSQDFFTLQTTYHETVSTVTMKPTEVITINQPTDIIRMSSEYKRDVARGLISYNTNFIVNGFRDIGIGSDETTLTSITGQTYIFPQVARRLRIKAGGNANDAYGGSGAWVIAIVGLNTTFDVVTETVVCAGASASAWTTDTFIRVNTCGVVATGTYGSNNVSKIIIECETELYELTAINAGQGRALSSVYTVPNGYSCVISRGSFVCDKEHTIDVTGWFRRAGDDTTAPFSAAMAINTLRGFSGSFESRPDELIRFDPYTDFWVSAKTISGTGNAMLTIIYDIGLLKNS